MSLALVVLIAFFLLILLTPKANGAQLLVLFAVILVGPRFAIEGDFLGNRPLEIRAEDLFLAVKIISLFFFSIRKLSLVKPNQFLMRQLVMVAILMLIGGASIVFSSSGLALIYLLPMLKGILLCYICCEPFRLSKAIQVDRFSMIALVVMMSVYFLYQEIWSDFCGERLFGLLLGTENFRQISGAWSGKINLGRSNLPFEREPAISGFSLLFLYASIRGVSIKSHSSVILFGKILLWFLVFAAILTTKSRSAIIAFFALPFLSAYFGSYLYLRGLFLFFGVGSLLGAKSIEVLVPGLQLFFSWFQVPYDPELESLKIRASLINKYLSVGGLRDLIIGKPPDDLVFDNQFVAFFSLFGILGLFTFVVAQLGSLSVACGFVKNRKNFLELLVGLWFACLTIEPFRSFRLFPAFMVYGMYVYFSNISKISNAAT